jgi:PPOX class probable FMN-dependent enzyme
VRPAVEKVTQAQIGERVSSVTSATERPSARPAHAIEPIRTIAELEAALGGPSTSSGVNTIRPVLAPIDVAWLAACPLWFIGTGADLFDVSPRGDEPGSILVLDEKTLVLPERAGNRRGDSYRNLLTNPRIGILFAIPGRTDTIRVAGHATMIRDAPWFSDLIVDGTRPPLAIRVDIATVFYHCVKAFRRGQTWQPEYWTPNAAPSRSEVAAALKCELTE